MSEATWWLVLWAVIAAGVLTGVIVGGLSLIERAAVTDCDFRGTVVLMTNKEQ